MSAPHHKAQDDASPLSWFGRKPSNGSSTPTPEAKAAERAIEFFREGTAVFTGAEMSAAIPVDLTKLQEELSINRLDEIAKLMRALTWREMMDLSEAWNTPADILWKWSKEGT